jgi:hypothetical protein
MSSRIRSAHEDVSRPGRQRPVTLRRDSGRTLKSSALFDNNQGITQGSTSRPDWHRVHHRRTIRDRRARPNHPEHLLKEDSTRPSRAFGGPDPEEADAATSAE